jgi:hypothetical protein
LHSDRDDPRRRGNLILQEDLFEYVKDWPLNSSNLKDKQELPGWNGGVSKID